MFIEARARAHEMHQKFEVLNFACKKRRYSSANLLEKAFSKTGMLIITVGTGICM